MKVMIEKAIIPVVWLDTSVYINMAKALDGGKICEVDRCRSLKLYEVIYRKVREKKLICPLGDQREEIEIGGKHTEKCYALQSQLSLGIEFCHRKRIEDVQFNLAMLAFIRKEEKARLKYTSAFYSDPINTIEEGQQFIVDAVFRPSKEWIEQKKCEKEKLLGSLNKLKFESQECRMTFKQRLEIENLGKFSEIKYALEEACELYNGYINPSKDQLYRHAELRRILYEWGNNRGSGENKEEFIAFLCSPQLLEMPYYRIRSHMYAKLITNDGKIKSGDAMDIDQVSAIIPFCDFVLCDRTMRNILRELKIDDDYSTKIYAASDCDIFTAELEKL